MMTMGTITADVEKMKSCSVLGGLPEPQRSELLGRLMSRAGEKVPLILPPVKKPTNKDPFPICQSTWFWQVDPQWVLENAQNEAEVFFCEHLLDLD